MARKRKELPLLEKVEITDVAAEGKAIAKVNDLVIFVPYVVPGDVVDLQIKRKKHHYADVFVRGENLLAQRYEINDGFPMPKATVMGGVNINF